MKVFGAAFLLLLASACVIVVEDEREEESGDTSYRYRERDTCNSQPYSNAPEYCTVYYARECCDWYVGNGCYETWCYAYRNCEEWQHTYSSCA